MALISYLIRILSDPSIIHRFQSFQEMVIAPTYQLLLQGYLVELQLVNLGGGTTREQGSGCEKGCLHIGNLTQKSENEPGADERMKVLR